MYFNRYRDVACQHYNSKAISPYGIIYVHFDSSDLPLGLLYTCSCSCWTNLFSVACMYIRDVACSCICPSLLAVQVCMCLRLYCRHPSLIRLYISPVHSTAAIMQPQALAYTAVCSSWRQLQQLIMISCACIHIADVYMLMMCNAQSLAAKN